MARRRAVALTILALGLAGCASSGSRAGTSPATYRASVNKICAAYNAKLDALPASTANSVAGLDKLLAAAKSTLAQVKAVAPPSSMSAAVDRWLGVVAQSSANATKLVSAYKAGDKSQVESLVAKGSTLNAQANADAKSLDLASCAVNAQPSAK